jgi:hemimethylated DNA binding protein
LRGNIDTGKKPSLSSSSPSVLEALHDKHLCCIRNQIICRIFTKYDSRTKSFIPNTYMNYTYPNWYPTNNIKSDNNTDRAKATTPDPSSFDGINKIENDNVDKSDRISTKISSDMLQQLKGFALHLISVIDNTMGKEKQLLSMPHKNYRPSGTNSNDNENHRNNKLQDTISFLRNDLHGMAYLDPTSAHLLLFNALPISKQLSLQLRSMEYVAMTILEAMYKRRRNKATIIIATQEGIDKIPNTHEQKGDELTMKKNHFTPKFHLGQIVRHIKYNFRGVIVGRDSGPIYNVSRWDGLRDVPNANELPFYTVIPDQQDCIEIFGGERPTRYVCEVNLEPCPPDQMYLDVDVDVGWTKLSDGSFRPPPFERFKYGYDNDDLDTPDATNDYDAFERCMIAVESELNKWHCECAREKLFHPQQSNNDDLDTTATFVSSSVVQKYALSIHDLLELLKAADNVEDAASIRDSIKLFGKANPNIELRTQLQYGIDLMVADNYEKARTIFRSIVTKDDPKYIEAWNYLAKSENFLSLQKDAFTSAKKVLELNNKDLQAYTQLGILYFQQGEYITAEINFRKCLDLDPWSIVSSKLSECIDIINERNDDSE